MEPGWEIRLDYGVHEKRVRYVSLPEPFYEKDGLVIYNADARVILPELADQSIDMIFTDPPFGHNNNNNGDLIHRREEALGRGTVTQEDSRPIANDGFEESNDLVKWLFRESKRLLAEGGCCCCCCGGGPDPQFARWSLWMDEILSFKQMVVWDKGPMGMGWHYRRSYETVLVGQRDKGKCRWYDDTDKVENIIRAIPKIIPSKSNHPTPKPHALPAYFIRLHSLPDHVVCDPFMGGGSTAFACKEMGRKFIGVELEERWCESTAKRLAQEVFDFK